MYVGSARAGASVPSSQPGGRDLQTHFTFAASVSLSCLGLPQLLKVASLPPMWQINSCAARAGSRQAMECLPCCEILESSSFSWRRLRRLVSRSSMSSFRYSPEKSRYVSFVSLWIAQMHCHTIWSLPWGSHSSCQSGGRLSSMRATWHVTHAVQPAVRPHKIVSSGNTCAHGRWRTLSCSKPSHWVSERCCRGFRPPSSPKSVVADQEEFVNSRHERCGSPVMASSVLPSKTPPKLKSRCTRRGKRLIMALSSAGTDVSLHGVRG